MVDVLRIKRRAAGGAAGPPSSLAAAEIAFNEQDNTLYYGKGNSGGLATTIVPIGGTGAPVVIVSDTAPASPSVGQLWFDSVNAQLYVWYNDGTSSQWTIVTAVNVPQPSNLTPLMDNVAVVGSSTLFSRADHVHPTDTSRYAASNPAGYVTAAGAASAAPVQSVATRTGAVTLNHTDILDWTASLAAPVPIGATTPNTGAFTTLSASGAVTANGFLTVGTATVASGIIINGPAASYRRMEFATASSLRWRLYTDFIAEGGANAGSDFRLDRYADDGSTFLGNAFLIARSTGAVTLSGNLTFGGGLGANAQDLSKQINLYGANQYGFNVTNDGAVNYNTAGFHRFWSGSTSLVTITSTAITFSVPVTVNGTTQLSGLNFGNVAVASPQDQSKHINLYGSNQYGFSVSTDSAVNYNSVVKHNFWIGSTSILTIGNSAITANWPVTVNGALTVSNGMFSCFVNSQVVPASGSGLSILWNFSGGQGEVNFFNNYIPAGGTRVFTWNQVTGTGTQRQLAALGPTSLTLNATNGIAYAGVTGGGNSIGFNWNAATSDVTLWVDGSNAGNLATKTFLGSNYLPLTGGTVTGATTFSAAGNALTVTNSAVINGFLTVGANTQSGTQIAVNGAAASSPGFSIRYAGSARWFIAADAFAETGGTTGNGGAGLAFYTYNNDGSFHGTALSITRDTYTTTFNGPLAATTFSGIATHNTGINFGSATSGGTTDLSRHIALYSNLYGFSITGGRLNYVCGTGGVHVFNIAGVDVGTFTPTGMNATAIGATTPFTGAFTTLSASGVVSGAGFTTLLASPPAIGGTAPSSGAFTTLSTTGAVTIAANAPINMGGTNSILWGTQVAIGYTGGDGNSTSVNNLRLASWNGIGFQNVGVATQVVPVGLYGAYVNARSGNIVAARLFATETLGATQLQNLRVTTSGTDQVLDITSSWAGYATLASTTPVAGGTGWAVNDRAYDAYNNFYTVMAVTAGAVTTIRLDTRASYTLAAPTNPITLTAAPGFVGTGLTVNLTWTASTRIVLQHSTGGLLLSSLNGTQVTGGMNFGSTSGSGPSDLSNHIALFSNTYGIGVSGLRMNHVVPQTSSNVLVCGTTDVLTINQNTVLSSVGIAVPVKSVAGTSYSAQAADSTLLIAPTGTFTLSLLNPVNWTGRFLRLKLTTAFAVNSASANVVPMVGGAATTAIMPATAGKFCLLQSDGTSWQIMEAN